MLYGGKRWTFDGLMVSDKHVCTVLAPEGEKGSVVEGMTFGELVMKPSDSGTRGASHSSKVRNQGNTKGVPNRDGQRSTREANTVLDK